MQIPASLLLALIDYSFIQGERTKGADYSFIHSRREDERGGTKGGGNGSRGTRFKKRQKSLFSSASPRKRSSSKMLQGPGTHVNHM
jgi:hypothetical protein